MPLTAGDEGLAQPPPPVQPKTDVRDSWDNPRMVWVGMDFKHITFHPCHGQGHLSLSWVAPSPVQSGPGHFQGCPNRKRKIRRNFSLSFQGAVSVLFCKNCVSRNCTFIIITCHGVCAVSIHHICRYIMGKEKSFTKRLFCGTDCLGLRATTHRPLQRCQVVTLSPFFCHSLKLTQGNNFSKGKKRRPPSEPPALSAPRSREISAALSAGAAAARRDLSRIAGAALPPQRRRHVRGGHRSGLPELLRCRGPRRWHRDCRQRVQRPQHAVSEPGSRADAAARRPRRPAWRGRGGREAVGPAGAEL